MFAQKGWSPHGLMPCLKTLLEKKMEELRLDDVYKESGPLETAEDRTETSQVTVPDPYGNTVTSQVPVLELEKLKLISTIYYIYNLKVKKRQNLQSASRTHTLNFLRF